MKIHNNILELICDGDVFQYKEYMKMLKDEMKQIFKLIATFLIDHNVDNLRLNVHKLISMICYLENNNELLHICKYILFQSKTTPESDMLNYLHFSNELLNYNLLELF